jgi:hypothetical protein
MKTTIKKFVTSVIVTMVLTSCTTSKKCCWKQNKASNYVPKIVKSTFTKKHYSL